MKDIFDSYCGIYCGSCIIRLAHVQNRPQSIPEPWKTWSKGMDLECHGCKSDYVYQNCAGCKMRSCAKEKRVDYCFTCEDFPCDKIPEKGPSDHFPHHKLALRHRYLLEENKVTEWLEYQKDRFTCKKCGNMFNWYEEVCHFCGEKVQSVVEELNQIR